MGSSYLPVAHTTPKVIRFIKRQIQTIKRILIKCEMDGNSPYMALLELRAIPLCYSTPSPVELLGNRKYKTALPAVTRAPIQHSWWGRVFSRGRNMLDMMSIPRSDHNLCLSSQYGYIKHPMSAYVNQPQWYPHQVRTLPGHMWHPCQMVPNTCKTGRCCGKEWHLKQNFQCQQRQPMLI